VTGTIANDVRQFYEFGPFRLDPKRHRLLRDGKVVPLPPKAVETLTVLVRNPGKPLGREELMQILWPDVTVEDANLTVAISQLRKVLNQTDDAVEFIETIPRVGYRFVADIRQVEEPAALVPEKHTPSESVKTIASDGEVTDRLAARLELPQRISAVPEQRRSMLGKRRLIMALIVILTIPAAVVAYHSIKSSRNARAEIRSVAVLPLKNLTGDPGQDYLADGFTEGLISSLSKIEGLKVISRGSIFAFKGKEVHPREAGAQLDVASVVEGSVRGSKNLMRITLRLVNTEDGRVLWSHESANWAGSDFFEIEDDLAQKTAVALRPELAAREKSGLAGPGTKNPEAYLDYLKGRYCWNKRTGPDLEQAIRYFEQAINLDPAYALGYSGLADSYAVLSYFSDRPFEESFPKAEAAAAKALEMDDRLAEPHATLGFVIGSFDWDWPRAEREYKHALQLNPNYATAHHWYGWYLMNVGRRDESVREMQRAVELDPLSLEINADLGMVLAYANRPDDAIKRLKAALEMDQNFAETRFALARAYRQKGEVEQAITEYEKVREFLHDRPDILSELGNAYARTGNTARARNILAQLDAMSRKQVVSPYYLAQVHMGLGEKNEALKALEEACQIRSSPLIALKWEPTFDKLRDEPRFQELLRRVGLPP
jgi:TolB-like protein/DNA-binding winged helix-turn-helix (wHTH) protein/Flp pilus assembly protein TadD